jgi:hypothetical protein
MQTVLSTVFEISAANKEDNQSIKSYHARGMSWLAGTAQRPVTGELERVFNIDITECEKCEKHNVSIIACIIDRLPARSTLSKKYWHI